jgi:hypothetical protein
VIRVPPYPASVPDPTLSAAGMASPAADEQPAGHRLPGFIPAGICCALAIAACGGSTNPSVSGGGQSGSLVSFAVCMRSHGEPNLPDPGSGGGGGGVSIVPAGINTSSPAFKTAWSTCAKLLLGMAAHQGASAQATQQMLKLSECMRSHGVSGFPDPTDTDPTGGGPLSSQSGYSAVIHRGGVWLAIPDTINPTSPTYRQAAAACRFGPSSG